MTAYKTQTKKDEETGTVKLSKIIVELTLGRCEYHRPNDFAKGDVTCSLQIQAFFSPLPWQKILDKVWIRTKTGPASSHPRGMHPIRTARCT